MVEFQLRKSTFYWGGQRFSVDLNRMCVLYLNCLHFFIHVVDIQPHLTLFFPMSPVYNTMLRWEKSFILESPNWNLWAHSIINDHYSPHWDTIKIHEAYSQNFTVRRNSYPVVYVGFVPESVSMYVTPEYPSKPNPNPNPNLSQLRGISGPQHFC